MEKDKNSNGQHHDSEGQAFRDKIRSEDSQTFNEDEPTYKEEQRTGGDLDAEEGETRNAGTEGNNWSATDPMQRENGLHGDERTTDQEAWKEENRRNGGAGIDYGTP